MAQTTLSQDSLSKQLPVSPRQVTQILGRALTYLIIFALCVLFGYPLFWTAMSSLKTIPEMF